MVLFKKKITGEFNLVLKGASASFFLKILSVLLGLCITLVLSRSMSLEDFGKYAVTISLLSVLGLPVVKGVSNFLVKELAVINKNKVTVDKCSVSWLSWMVSLCYIFLLVLFIVCFGENYLASDNYNYKYVIFLLIPMTIYFLLGAYLRSVKRVVRGQMPDNIIRPLFFLFFLVAFVLFNQYFNQNIITYDSVLKLNIVAALISVLFMIKMTSKGFLISNLKTPKSIDRRWKKSMSFFVFIAAAQLINRHSDIVMIGYYLTSSDSGVYKVCVQLASLVSFGLGAVNIAIQPYIVKFYKNGEIVKLQKMIGFSSIVLFVISLVTIIMFLNYGENILNIMFGSEYIVGFGVLIIISIGELVNVIFGSVSYLLNMTGWERLTAKALILSALINIVLNCFFIPIYGVYGAAVATLITYLIWNIILWRTVYTKIGIDSTFFGLFRKAKNG